MHECLLLAPVPSNQQAHILRILAGISAMQPLSHLNCHLIFKPVRTSAGLPTTIPGRPSAPTSKPGSTNPYGSTPATQSNDLFYLQLVGDLTLALSEKADSDTELAMEIDSEQPTTSVEKDDDETRLWSAYSWTLNYAAVPDVQGKRTATSRLVSTVPLLDGNPRVFMHGLGYVFVGGYVVDGWRLTHNHLNITLCRTIPLPADATQIPVTRILDIARGDGLKELEPLDASGGYLLQVSVRVSDGSKPELMNKAFAELAAFRDMLRGVVSLQPVERLGLDTRVRGDKVTQTQVRSAGVMR